METTDVLVVFPLPPRIRRTTLQPGPRARVEDVPELVAAADAGPPARRTVLLRMAGAGGRVAAQVVASCRCHGRGIVDPQPIHRLDEEARSRWVTGHPATRSPPV